MANKLIICALLMGIFSSNYGMESERDVKKTKSAREYLFSTAMLYKCTGALFGLASLGGSVLACQKAYNSEGEKAFWWFLGSMSLLKIGESIARSFYIAPKRPKMHTWQSQYDNQHKKLCGLEETLSDLRKEKKRSSLR